MEMSTAIMGAITHYTKYARYVPEARRRETWEETCVRNMKMHQKRFPFLPSPSR